ncbi:MAG: hypothetical protein KF899_07350 [Parvibaculum sp.]|nr:hypothetical protein [Parvibaculum sp.]
MMNRLAALLLPLVLIACGPVMEQRRDFTPPASEAGMQCVQNCQKQQTTCQRDEQQRKDQCRAQADRRADRAYEKARDNYITALKLHAADAAKYPMPVEPTRQANYAACNVSSQCEPQYHSCYRSCGGQINEYQVCVAACE